MNGKGWPGSGRAAANSIPAPAEREEGAWPCWGTAGSGWEGQRGDVEMQVGTRADRMTAVAAATLRMLTKGSLCARVSDR